MPNWCNNTVEIGHTDPAKLKELMDAFNEGKFCHYAIPVPEELNIVAGRVGADEDEKQIALEAAEKSNREKYGHANWYDFCVANWGTKWDVGGDSAYGDPVVLEPGQTNVTINFDSAWAPPCGAYEALLDKGFEVRAYYYEPGMNFAGVWDNGVDDCLEIPGSAKEVREDEAFNELDEIFGISESMEMYEEEEEE